MITHKLPSTYLYINIYPIADVHIGSKQFNKKAFNELIKTVKADPYGFVVMAGDILNNGIKSSKSNVYEEVIRPRDQKEYAYEVLLPIADKILACCGGNHCHRTNKEVDSDPLYDVMCRLGIPELYRENGCIVKINLGERNKARQVSYAGVVTHGTSKNKHDKFCMGIDNADFFISGHTHQAEYTPKGKIRIDTKNEVVTLVGYKQIVCHSFQDYGGYALRSEYTPKAPTEFQKLKLYGNIKKMVYSEE